MEKLKATASSYLVAVHEVQLWSSVVISILQKYSNKSKYSETIKLLHRDIEHHGKRSFALTNLMTEQIPETCKTSQTNMWPYEIQKCTWDPRNPDSCNYPAWLSIAKNLPVLSPQGIPEIHWRVYHNIDSQLGPDCTAYRNANANNGFGSGMSIALSNDDNHHRAFPHGKDQCKDIAWWAKQWFPVCHSQLLYESWPYKQCFVYR
jgi:hypothetical protein